MMNKMGVERIKVSRDRDEEITNRFESKCDMKIETNSRGHNTTVHVYEGCTEKQIDDTVVKTVYAHLMLQETLAVPPEELVERFKNEDK
jgi:hypothetical protein